MHGFTRFNHFNDFVRLTRWIAYRKHFYSLKTSAISIKTPFITRLRCCPAFFKEFTMDSANFKSQSLIQPQAQLQGMKILDRSAFNTTIKVPYICLSSTDLNKGLKKLKKVILKIRNFTSVKDLDEKKQILLNPDLLKEIQSIVQNNELPEISWTEITLNYENWGYDTILKSILPPDLGDGVAAFSVIGHILHLNLKEPYRDYKNIIGEIFLDKFKNIKTVVNKQKTIDGTFRNFEIELLAGEPEYEVIVKENGLQYSFDFSKVFWNPRLQTEHSNVTSIFNEGDIVFDIFAGVGPFAIPAAKKGCFVHANDLNPDSYKWLCRNIDLNKVSEYATAYNLDGRDFITSVFKEKLSEFYNSLTSDENSNRKIHVLMNLPASALEFISSFTSLLDYSDKYSNAPMPILYVYFFVKTNEKCSDDMIKNHLSNEIQESIISINNVRNVAPNKQMYRVTFSLPRTILFSTFDVTEDECKRKKIKLDLS